MKRFEFLIGVLIMILTTSASGCTLSQAAADQQTIQSPIITPSSIPIPTSESYGQGVTFSTSVASSSGPFQSTATPEGQGSSINLTPLAPPEGGVTLANNGAIYILHRGDRFLLNLGNDLYDWTIAVDNQAVMSRVVNILVIRSAQGLYEAHSSGTTTLTAGGDPLCHLSKPACEMPSILFKITVVVQ